LSYVLVRPVCSYGLPILEYAVTLAMLAAVAAGGYVAVQTHRGALSNPPTTVQFLAVAAMVLNALFGYAIIIEAIPNLVVSPCL
jgi:hypothetical protein